MIKAVIVGCAHMHVNEIALYISEQPGSELAAVADVAPKISENTDKRYTRAWNLNNVVTKYGAKKYDDYVQMLDAEKPDVAYVLCENYRKLQVASEIASRGIDVIIEKPMATTFEEAKQIVALKEKYGVNIFVNWPVTWRGYVRRMKVALDSGMCGEIKKLRYINGHTGPLGKGARHRGVLANSEDMTDGERSRIWWYQKDCGGGAYLDILCYGCYFARWIFGKVPNEMICMADNLNTPCADTVDNLAAVMRYEGAMAVAEATWTTPRRRMPTGPELVCSDGVIWCDGVSDGEAFAAACDMSGNDLEIPELENDEAFQNMAWQYAAFKTGRSQMHETLSAEFNADVVAMIEAGERANGINSAVKPQSI